MLSLNCVSFQGVIFCHFMQKIWESTMRRGYIYKIHPRERRSHTVFLQAYFSSRLISVFYLRLHLSAQALWPNSSWCCTAPAQRLPAPPTSLSPATTTARPWTWGRYASVRLVSLVLSLFLTGSCSVITESCWDVACEVAWVLWGEQGWNIILCVRSAASVCGACLCGKLWADSFESHAIILFKLFLQTLCHYVALASVSILNQDLTSDEIKLNLTPGPTLIISFKFNGVHTAISYLIQILL